MCDFHFDRVVGDGLLRSALGKAYSVSAETIRFIPELTGREDLRWVSLLGTTHTSAGDFPHHVSVYSQGASRDLPSELEVARTLARTLGARCLISDEGANPFSWLLVDSLGERAVSLQPEALEREELVLAQVKTP